MAELLFHPATEELLWQNLKQPSHALMLVGPPGSGKASTARFLAANLLDSELTQLDQHPYVLCLAPTENKAISIEAVRQLQHFMSLRIPGKRTIARIAIIENAQLLTAEAQNALLKTLEEPPADTMLILTANSTETVLPTIQSRVRVARIVPPSMQNLKDYFIQNEFPAEDIDKALLVSGGLPGLTHALLISEAGHPLYEATQEARALIQATAYERLVRVDALSKQRQLCMDILFILGQMSRTALLRSVEGSSKGTARWQQILKASLEAQERLRHSANLKLTLSNLMLEI